MHVFLDAAELAQFGLDHDPLGVGAIDDPPGRLDVLLELLVRGVDHHRAVEAALDAVVADLFGAVVEVDGEDHLGKDLVGRADHRLQEPLVGVAAGAAGNLEDERGTLGRVGRLVVRLRLAQIAAEQAHGLFEVVDVVRPHGILAVGVLKQLFRGDDHGTRWLLLRLRYQRGKQVILQQTAACSARGTQSGQCRRAMLSHATMATSLDRWPRTCSAGPMPRTRGHARQVYIAPNRPDGVQSAGFSRPVLKRPRSRIDESMSMEAAATAGMLSPFEQLRFARQVILTESRALAQVANRLDGEFCRAANCSFSAAAA